MSAPSRRRTSAAIALTAGITAGAALLLTACGPEDATGAGSAPSATTSGAANGGAGNGGSGSGGSGGGSGKGTNGSSGAAKPVSSSAPVPNGTAHNGLTISDGSRYVVMNGTRVDFGTAVRDLAWSPDGRKAAFVDGDGDLAVSDPDGSGRVIVAKNPGGQNWSHPTWQVRAPAPQDGMPAANNLFFAVRTGNGTTQLYVVPATAHAARPKVLGLNHESGEDIKPLPQTGNTWPSSAGKYGSAVYANPGTGEVYIRDDYLRQQGSALTKGSEPALSPGEDQDIVFVRSVGGHDHLFVEHSTNSGPTYKDITPNATTDYTEPTWSPDGRTIAARTADGIVTLPANGSQAPVKVSGYVGLPGYRA
jgi:WD40-like Beta Propeller Repeat